MEYAFLSSLKPYANHPIRLVTSYDIMCQWGKNLHRRIKTMPPELQVDLDKFQAFTTAIGKLHITDHKDACRVEFSLNFLLWVARTDSESIE